MRPVLLGALAALVTAPAIQAAGLEGGAISATQYNFYSDGGSWDYSANVLSGQLSFGITPQVGVQIDAMASGYDGQAIGSDSSFGIHGYYRISPETTIGAFIGRTDFGGFYLEEFYGIEGRHDSGPLTIQGYYGADKEAGVSYQGRTIMGLKVEYDIETISSFGDFTAIGRIDRFGDDPGSYTTLSVGGRVGFGGGTYAELTVGRGTDIYGGGGSNQNSNIKLTLGYTFGNGPTFDRRDYMEVFQGY